MTNIPPNTPKTGFVCRLMPVAVFAVWLMLGNMADAASFTTASAFDAKAHSEVCGCGERCKHDSCCCGAKKPAQVEKSGNKLPKAISLTSPCLKSAPCHDPALPTGSSGLPLSRLAVLPGQFGLVPDNSAELMGLSPQVLAPVHCPSRIDRPPRVQSSI
jgi:hypothetical protein